MTQTKKVKNQLLASKISVIRSLNNEQALKYELTQFFQNLKKTVLHELEEYYNEEFMFQAHADLILAPIFEAQQEYYNILRKFNHKEYNFGRKEGRRLVKLARKRANRNSIAYADKAKTPSILNASIKKDNLFGTNPWSEEKLLNQSFTASEKTMNRVDSDINKILSDGYREGKGINSVRNDISRRFDLLSSWEAQRIARTEIHNAHNMGTMDIYQEMGVEYTQWIAARDNKTRDSHREINREIIPMGGTYSNDLRFPGDTTGKLKEWINCRCSNAPFVIPDGYLAPSFTPFREKDLIPTLDYWNQDDLIRQATSEMRETIPNEIDSLMSVFKRSSNAWDINRLTPQEKEMYLKYKKNYLILKDAMKKGDYSKLDELEDLGGYYAIRDKKSFLEFTDNGKDFKLWLKGELDDYLDDIKDYEKIIKDTNIKVDIKPRGIKWNNTDLKDYRILNDNGKYVHVNQEEKFIKYYFKDEKLTILESVDMDTSRVRSVYESYKKLPKNLKNTKEIVLSSQKPRIVNFWGSDSYVGGYVTSKKGNTTIIQFKKTVGQLKDTLVHESAHLLEKDKNWYISNSKEYIFAFKKDQQRLLKQGLSLDESYVTPYARDFTEEFVTKRSLAIQKYGNRQYSEDFAESVKMYLKDKKAFTEKFPNKAKVIEKAIKGKYTPKNTTPYNNWLKLEKDRFALTEKEFKREQKLRWKDKLTSSERKELEYLQDKRTLDYVYNKKIKGEILDNAEEKAFENLTKKWRKKLNMPKTSVEEISNTNWTKKDEKRLQQLLKKEKEDSLDGLMEEFELIELEEKKKLSLILKKNPSLNYTKFELTKGEQQELTLLREVDKKRGRLLYKDRKKLRTLEEQTELDKLHKKYILQGKLSEIDADRYKELHNDISMMNKFNLKLIKNTDKLRGITPKEASKPVIRPKSKWDDNLEKLKETSSNKVDDVNFVSYHTNPKKAIDDLVEIQKLTNSQLKLPKKWSGAANTDMNKFLKGVLDKIESGEFKNIDELEDYVNKLIQLIDNLPKNKSISKDTLLYRGINFDNMSEKEILTFFEKGKTKKLKTFTSTTYDIDTADQFAEYSYGGGYIIRIHAPKGTKGIGINEDISAAYEEYEYLLSPNQKFKTLDIDKENHIIDILLI